jgi:glycosyltransferase involved in cell wall biosynthesis
MTAELSVAAVVPVFNGAAFIEKALASIQAQTFPPARIVIADDRSTDNTAEVVALLAQADRRIEFIRMPVNGGPSAARNAAVVSCSEELVAMLDADDEWLPHHLERLHSCFRGRSQVALAFGHASTSRDVVSAVMPDIAGRPLQIWPGLICTNVLPQSAVVIRREALQDVGGYDERLRFAEDYDLWLRIALAGREFYEVPQITCLRSRHEGQVTRRHALAMVERSWQLRRSVVAQKFGQLEDMPSDWVSALESAAVDQLRGAWALRDRDVLSGTVSAVAWVPHSEGWLNPWRKRAGAAWPVWRTAAAGWDLLQSLRPIRESQD